MWRYLIVVVVLFHFSSPSIATKCIFLKYEVEGRVVLPTNVDAADVHLVLFLDGSPEASDYSPDAGSMDYVSPSPSGEFRIVSHYNKASKRGCRRIAENGQLVVIGKGIRSRREILDFGDRRSINAAAGAILKIGEVKLSALKAKTR